MLIFFVYQISIGQTSGNLKIEVTGLRNDEGKVGIRLFDKSEGFPSERKKAIKEFFVTPVNGKAIFTIEDQEFGTYAIGTIHDENENKEFDKNFIGYPKEGFGTSNNPKIFMGPPSFDKAKFDFSKDNQSLSITMKYF
jgi:uncharacterized protein (DUF2141 family)